MAVVVREEGLGNLKKAVGNAGQEYKENLAKLTNLIEEITRGDIQGDLANDLVAKFDAKKETLNKITQTIEDAEGYLGLQGTKFTSMMDTVKTGMK